MANSLEKIDSTDRLATAFEPIPHPPFLSAMLFLKEILKEAIESFDSTETSLSPDTFHFGMFSHQLEQDQLLLAIQERREEIYEQKEHWRSFVDKRNHAEFYTRIENVLDEGKLLPHPLGTGGAYLIVDAQGIAHFILKPVDEDIYCLNNRKEFGSLFNDSDHRVRDHIPLYRSAQIDALCWEVASLAGLEETTPQAVMGILKEESFYDFTYWLDETKKNHIIQETGLPDKEKLCSIQKFIPDSQDLNELLHELYAAELSDEEICSHFDQSDFEQVCMLLWLSYDNDAHSNNFRVYLKRIDEIGKKIYGIKKIDNSLSFPERNTHYMNILTWMPNALLPISPSLKQKIFELPTESILQRLEDYELSSCAEAFKERVEILKILAQQENITIVEIDLRMSFLSKATGKELALSTLTKEQILELLCFPSPGTSHV